MRTKQLPLFLLVAGLLSACSKDGSTITATNSNTGNNNSNGTWWKPVAGVTFDWDLDDVSPTDTFSAAVVDVDAFTTSAEVVTKLHAAGKKVIAYISVGTLEDDRPDANLLPKEVIGKVYPEWPHEKWLDIRQVSKLMPWLNERVAMIVQKGFDGIEPDNMDGYSNETGFNITLADAKNYADSLISLAHKNGLSIGQKNVDDLTADYAAKFDWALTEDAFQQGWQNNMKPYITLNKPVFAVEYTDVTKQATSENSVCPQAQTIGLTAILKHRELDKWTYSCK